MWPAPRPSSLARYAGRSERNLRMPAQYAIGIDLGTTNSVLAYALLGEERPQLHLLPIPQLVAAGTVEERNVLPSFLYLGTDADAASGAYDLPWEKGRRDAVGA